MSDNLVIVAYLAASAMFILSLGGLSRQESARRGNLLGIVGMVIALAATALRSDFQAGGMGAYGWLIAALVPGALAGWIIARRVQMTSMPQLVAILHSFVGMAAVLVGIATYLGGHNHALSSGEKAIHLIEIFVGVAIGSITFAGSVIAFAKLQGVMSGKPLILPARHLLNLALLGITVWFGIWFYRSEELTGLLPLLLATGVTAILGVHSVMAIGGADMPVVVSMLNSYSGWAAAAAGFMLGNDLLIITGALVGSSGAILSIVMCRGMNRSFISVIMGGFGTSEGAAPTSSTPAGEVRSIDVPRMVELIKES